MRGSSPSEVRPAPRLPRARARSSSAQKVAHAPLQFVSPPLRPAGDRARLAAFEPCRDFEPRPAHLPPPPSTATRRSDPRHWIRGCGCLGGSVSVLRGWRATKQREEARAGALRAQRASVQVRYPLAPRPAAVPAPRSAAADATPRERASPRSRLKNRSASDGAETPSFAPASRSRSRDPRGAFDRPDPPAPRRRARRTDAKHALSSSPSTFFSSRAAR